MKILTINIWDIPLISKDRNLRLERLLKFLKEDKPKIVCIQESFDLKTRKKILDTCTSYKTPKIAGLTGGLLTLVHKNIEIIAVQFLRFKERSISLEENIVKKGFLVVKIICNGKPLTIINTHLHRSLIGLDRDSVRSKQLQEIENYIANHQKPFLLVGDFQDITNLYGKLIDLGYYDMIDNPVPTLSANNPYTFAMFNKLLSKQIDLKKRGGVRQDLIFSRNDKTCPVIPIKSQNVLNTENTLVSDHYGVLLNFRLG